MIYIFLFILLFIFIPIKLNICMIYEHNKINLFLWNHKINLDKFKNKKESINPVNTSHSIKNKKENRNFLQKFKKLKLYLEYIKKLLPINSLNIKINYGFDEPNITAITYGFKDLIISYIINILKCFLIIKNYSFEITPTLKEKNLYLSINSIIYISIGKVIFIGSKLLLKKYKGEL